MTEPKNPDHTESNAKPSWIDDGSSQFLGQMATTVAVIGALGIWAKSRGFFNGEAFWLIMMLLLAGGMRLSGWADRRELARRRTSAREAQDKESYQQQILEDCEQRRIRREAIRSGEINDDGLTEWGRSLKENNELNERTRSLQKKFGVESFLPETENIFELEKEDKKIEAAWKRKLAADAAWEKLISK